MNMLSPIDAQPSAIEVLTRMKAAHAAMGGAGRFSLTYSVGADVECYATHWFRPDPHAFEDCRTITAGTLAECLAGIERYAAARSTVPAIAAE